MCFPVPLWVSRFPLVPGVGKVLGGGSRSRCAWANEVAGVRCCVWIGIDCDSNISPFLGGTCGSAYKHVPSDTHVHETAIEYEGAKAAGASTNGYGGE